VLADLRVHVRLFVGKWSGKRVSEIDAYPSFLDRGVSIDQDLPNGVNKWGFE
jgi:hypothetical protein